MRLGAVKSDSARGHCSADGRIAEDRDVESTSGSDNGSLIQFLSGTASLPKFMSARARTEACSRAGFLDQAVKSGC